MEKPPFCGGFFCFVIFVNLLFKIIAATLLLASGISKLIFIEPFEVSLVESNIVNWEIAPVAIRAIVIIEFIIAISLLLKSIRSKSLSLSILLLNSFYLIDFFSKPADALYVNYFSFCLFSKWITLGGIIYLIIFAVNQVKQNNNNSFSRLKNMLIKTCLAAIISIPLFIINPIYIDDFQKNETSVEKSNLDWSTIYQNCEEKNIILTPETEVFFAFLSTSCYYCNSAAIRLGVSKRAKLNPTQIVLVFPGNIKDTEYFIERNRCDFPYIRISKDEFRKLAGNEFPAFFKVKNKKETNYYTGRTLNLRELDNLFQLN
jgi:hypothetical protein